MDLIMCISIYVSMRCIYAMYPCIYLCIYVSIYLLLYLCTSPKILLMTQKIALP